MNHIGQCFYCKQWYADAVEVFEQALAGVESDDSAEAKELRYNLGRAYQANGQIGEAMTNFRKVAQIDFNYQDVKKRIDELRQQQQEDGKNDKKI